MKIVVNTRLLLTNKLEGIGWFTHEVFKRLVQQHPEVEWHFLFDRPYDTSFIYEPNVTAHVIAPPTRHPFLWHWWFQFSVPRLLKKINPALFISPDGFIPLNTTTPTLPIIHDINFEHQKVNTGKLVGWYLRKYFRLFAQVGTRVGTVSEYSKLDLVKTYGLEEAKIDIIYNGVGDFFKPLSRNAIKATRQKISRGLPYFIFIGALNPRKNIDGMLEAYTLYRQQGGQALFVIVGEKMFWNKQLDQAFNQHPFKKDIIFTGRLERDALNEALASAQALAFVSHFEGFGIPILEAFKSNVPVITATNSSMPEVADDAALLCPASDSSAIAAAYLKTDNPAVCQQLIKKGQARGKFFSWDKSAEMMWTSIEKTVQHA